MSNKHEGPHKYIKKKIGDKSKPYKLWKCAIPGCTHYIKYELGEGRFTICWRCGATCTLDKLTMELTRPHCKSCTRGKKEEDVAIKDSIALLTTLFGGGGSN